MSDILFNIILYILQVIALLGGFSFGYFAIFTYEDEDGYLQDKLETWWIKLEDMRPNRTKLIKSFMNRVFFYCSDLYNTIFGNKIISIKMISISVSMSFTSLMLAQILSIFFKSEINLSIVFNCLISTMFFIVFLNLSLSNIKEIKYPIIRLYIAIFAYFLFLLLNIIKLISEGFFIDFSEVVGFKVSILFSVVITIFGMCISYIFMISLGILTDIICIISFRLFLQKILLFDSIVKMLSFNIMFSIFTYFIAGVIPIAIAYFIINYAEMYVSILPSNIGNLVIVYLLGGSAIGTVMTNLPSFITGSLIIIFSITLILGHFFWPMIVRIVYSLQRYKIFNRKVFLWSISISLMVASGLGPVTKLVSWLKSFLKAA